MRREEGDGAPGDIESRDRQPVGGELLARARRCTRTRSPSASAKPGLELCELADVPPRWRVAARRRAPRRPTTGRRIAAGPAAGLRVRGHRQKSRDSGGRRPALVEHGLRQDLTQNAAESSAQPAAQPAPDRPAPRREVVEARVRPRARPTARPAPARAGLLPQGRGRREGKEGEVCSGSKTLGWAANLRPGWPHRCGQGWPHDCGHLLPFPGWPQICGHPRRSTPRRRRARLSACSSGSRVPSARDGDEAACCGRCSGWSG